MGADDRYKLILDLATEGFWDWDLQEDRAYLSPRYCEMVGYSADVTRFDTEFLHSIVHPDDRELVFGVIGELRRGTRQQACVEHRLLKSDGTCCWVEARARIVEYDALAVPVRMVGTVVDITERRRAEQLQQQSHTLLGKFSQQVPGALFQTYIYPDGHICTPYSSDKLYDVYEVAPEQLHADIGAIVERFHPDDRERIMSSIAVATEQLTRWECEYRVILPRQGLRWLYGTALPQRLEDGTVEFCGIIMDITERKRIEEHLDHSRQMLGSIVDNSPYAVFVKDVRNEFRVVLWNKTAETVFGIPAASILGKHAHDLWPKEQADAYLANDRTVVATRSLVDMPEEVSAHPEKGEIYLQTRKIPLFDAQGEVSHVVVISDDISERRMLQEEMLKNQKLESLGVLAGGIAHDFNNILTGVLGNISYARSMLPQSHKALDVLYRAELAANRATDLAHQLLTFAKGGKPVKKAITVRQALEAATGIVLSGSRVSSRLEIAPDLPAIEADEGQLSQVLNNLIINACQAMPGGGTITITADAVAIAAANPMALAPGLYVRLSLADTGCGIPEDEQKRIFDPYYTTKPGGSGLGLASVHSIISKHGGYIGVHSHPGQGSTFDILLPACQHQAAGRDSVALAMPPGSGAGQGILLMDDEPLIRDLGCMMLGELGYRVQVCSCGEEAISLYVSARESGMSFAAVIMDLTVPGRMGGLAAARKILEIDPQARLIVSSGYSEDPIMDDYARHGFKGVLLKPYPVERLTEVLQRVLAAAPAAVSPADGQGLR